MKRLQIKITPKGRNKTGYGTYRGIKLELKNKLQKQRIRSAGGSLHCRLKDIVAVAFCGQRR